MRGLLDRILSSERCLEAYERLKMIKGLGLVVHWAARKAVPPASGRWVEVASGSGQGLALLIYPRFEIAYARGDHEPCIQDLLSSLLRPGDVFFDVGAHVGFFSLIAARLIGPEGSVFAFEPDPDNLTRLEANIARNAVTWVRPIHAVASDHCGVASFARSATASSRMEGRVVAEAMIAAEMLTVQSTTLDDHYDPRRGIVKVDAEGGELLVLKGARRLLENGNLHWIVEAHSQELEAEVIRIFRDAHYSWLAIGDLRSPSRSAAMGRYVIAARDLQHAGISSSKQ